MLLHHLNWTDGDVTIIGYSLGGAVSIAFSSWKTNLIEKVILISPAGLMESVPITASVFTLPIFGETMSLLGLSQILMKQSSYSNYKVKLWNNQRFDWIGTHMISIQNHWNSYLNRWILKLMPSWPIIL